MSKSQPIYVFLSLLLSLYIPGKLFSQENIDKSAPKTIVIRGRIVNGTRQIPVQVSELKLIKLNRNMEIVEEKKNVGPHFSFRTISGTNEMFMLRAVYKNQVYHKYISPSGVHKKIFHKLMVYDIRPLPSKPGMVMALQITKIKNGLKISKIFVIRNKSQPRVAYSPDSFVFFLPNNASNIRSELKYAGSRIPFPVKMTKTAKGYSINRGFLPGRSTLTISYFIAGNEFIDRRPAAMSKFDPHQGVLVWWRPQNARPVVTEGRAESIDIPGVGAALKLQYSETGVIRFNLKKGDIVIPDNTPIEINNPVFDTATKTIIGVFAVFFLFLTWVSIVRASGLRIVRKNSIINSTAPP